MHVQFRQHRGWRVPGHGVIQYIQHVHQLGQPGDAFVPAVAQRRLLESQRYANGLWKTKSNINSNTQGTGCLRPMAQGVYLIYRVSYPKDLLSSPSVCLSVSHEP